MFNLSSDDQTQFYLAIDGKKYEGWYRVTVDTGLDQFAHTFSLSYTDRWTEDSEPWPIFPDASCVLYWGGIKIVTGYITRTEHDITGDSYDLEASGRSITSDLVDCSAIHKTGQWRQKTLIDIVQDICAPFNIIATDLVSANRKFKRFELDEGETAHDAISRACRIRGVLPITDNIGAVNIVRGSSIGFGTVSLDVDTVISRGLWHDSQNRYSEYHFKGQTSADDKWYGENSALQIGYAEDADVPRYRPLVILSESQSTKEDLGERAIWERGIRAAKSDQVTYTVDGITDSLGNPWTAGTIVRVQDPILKINAILLLNAVNMRMDNDVGLQTTLTLIQPEALDLIELPERGNAYNAR